MREWIAAFARRAGNYVPDAAASAVIMLFALAGTSLALGDGLLTNVDAFYRGLWMLLPFSMQMTLILVLSTVLSLTAAFRRAIRRIADLPQTVTQVIALAVCVNSILSYLYWGLGLAMGPLIAVYFAEAAERKGLRIDFPFLLATVFAVRIRLAVRAVVDGRAVGGDTWTFPGAGGRRHGARHDDRFVARAHGYARVPAVADPAGALPDAAGR